MRSARAILNSFELLRPRHFS
uniref:Uncharacterized protein n=1 Tax=Physcomitrium patens TaxID=3218 RepID=A0A2K1IGT6_PHYPA|nr:hypothetical protein PHYPA_029083 [Physcomitrium patens]